MDRIIVYPSEIPTDTMFLATNKNTMVALGYLMQAVLGAGTLVDGLACTPTSPAGMTVNVAGGSIYAQEEIDATGYGTIAADTTDLIVKQGIVIPTTNFSCPAPGTSGQSVVYLVEAIYQDVDAGSTVLPYYNASNPSVPYSGPGNDGQPQYTQRQGVCTLALKTGVAATTGTQVTPSPDAGYTGLWAITVANGQTTITSGNIAKLATAPFISPKLPAVIAAVQAGTANYAADTSGAANTIAVALSPAVSALTTGMRLWVKVANTNTGGVVINTNSLGNVAANRQDGTAIPAGALQANGLYLFAYDGTYWQLQGVSARPQLAANTTYYVATTGSDSNSGLTSGTPFLTIQKAINTVLALDLNGFNVTISVADGTYTGAAAVNTPFVGQGNVTLQGNSSTPANCIISTTSADCVSGAAPASLNILGFKLTSTSGNGLTASPGFVANITGNMNFGAVGAGKAQLNAYEGGQINTNASYTISGGGGFHYLANNSASIIVSSPTVTLTGTPAFTNFANAAFGVIGVNSGTTTFSGSATGIRYVAGSCGVINTSGSGATYLPGNAGGSTSTGGQYI